MARDLRDKVIVITGASSGIGAATAVECARAGMHVVLAARRRELLDRVAQQIEALGRRALVVPCDVGKEQDVRELVNQTVAAFGRIDAIFANAGYGLFGTVIRTPADQARELFEVNFWGTVRLIDAAVPVIARNPGKHKGHVLICSSAASESGLPYYGYYSASKAAQDSIADAMGAEMYKRGIDVTSVHPIGTRTDFFDAAAQRAHSNLNLNTPQGLLQDPRVIARRIVRALRRPKPEVWGSALVRIGLAAMTAFPRLGSLVRRMLYHRHRKYLEQEAAP